MGARGLVSREAAGRVARRRVERRDAMNKLDDIGLIYVNTI
jgi:hypothetical protein